MGFRYRRSFRMAPGVRLNVSKSGLGFSAGGRRYRVTRHAGGRLSRAINLPIRGLSHHRTLQRRSWRVPILLLVVALVLIVIVAA